MEGSHDPQPHQEIISRDLEDESVVGTGGNPSRLPCLQFGKKSCLHLFFIKESKV